MMSWLSGYQSSVEFCCVPSCRQRRAGPVVVCVDTLLFHAAASILSSLPLFLSNTQPHNSKTSTTVQQELTIIHALQEAHHNNHTSTTPKPPLHQNIYSNKTSSHPRTPNKPRTRGLPWTSESISCVSVFQPGPHPPPEALPLSSMTRTLF